jgi:hypothetical protein
MFSKLRLSKLGIISCAVVLFALLAGSFTHPAYLPVVFLFATVVLTFLAFAIYNSLRLNLPKTVVAPTIPKQWKMLFFATISTGFSLILFLTTFVVPDYSELLGVGLLFSLTASVYLFLASQSVALKSIGTEIFYWIGGLALHSCVFFMLYTMEREFYSIVIFLFIASIIALLASFIYPHLKRAITKKDNLSYLFSSTGFTLLVSYSAVVTFLRNYKTISIGYQFMDFAFITIFYAMMISGMDIDY